MIGLKRLLRLSHTIAHWIRDNASKLALP